MNSSIHPSPEELSSYFDKELSASEREPIESHLTGCTSCQDELKAFEVLSEMGPLVEESLPGEAYWSDLPSRVLLRIQQEETPEPVTVKSGEGRWSWLWNPQGRWRYAVGTAVSFGLVAGLWFVLGEQQVPGNLDVADNITPVAPAPVAAPQEDPTPFDTAGFEPALNPNSYKRRVYTTYGNRRNLGTNLDFDPGSSQATNRTPVRPGGVTGQQVTQSAPTLRPEMRPHTEGVVSYACGPENPIEAAYIAALMAEAEGDYRMAIQGYRVIRANVPAGNALHHEAEFRLNYLVWKQRLRSRGNDPAALAELNALAQKAYQTWQETQRNQDCREAWCMNRIAMQLDSEIAAASQKKVNQLKNCVE